MRAGRPHQGAQTVTETSTKGLLPQLTDVLNALTESHVMLLRKVQCLRLEHTNSALSVVSLPEGYPDALFGPTTDWRPSSLVDVTTSTMLAAPTATPLDEVEQTPSPSEIASSQFDRIWSTAARHDEGQGVDQEVTSPTPATAEGTSTQRQTDTGVGLEQQTPRRLDQLEGQQTQPTHTKSDRRNYNFFDELDARLASSFDKERPQETSE